MVFWKWDKEGVSSFYKRTRRTSLLLSLLYFISNMKQNKMEQGKTYNIKVEVNGKILIYSKSLVTKIDEHFITFIDSYTNKPISYNINVVVFYEEYVEVIR